MQVDYQALNASPNAVLVSRRQEGNPLLKHIRNVRWTFADIVPDYIMGADSCALFLSMRSAPPRFCLRKSIYSCSFSAIRRQTERCV